MFRSSHNAFRQFHFQYVEAGYLQHGVFSENNTSMYTALLELQKNAAILTNNSCLTNLLA